MKAKKINSFLVLLALTMYPIAISAQQKNTTVLSIDIGASVPIGDYAAPGYNADSFSGEPGAYAIPGFNFKFNTSYYLVKGFALSASLVYNNNVFFSSQYAQDVKKRHQNSVYYDLTPMKTSIKSTNWSHLGFAAGIMGSIPFGKFVADGKILAGFNSYSTPVINQITLFDDPSGWNQLEDTRIKSSSGSSFLAVFGLGLRYQLKRIGFGINIDAVTTPINSKADFYWEERDDYYSYEIITGKYNWKFSATWINFNVGVYYTIGD